MWHPFVAALAALLVNLPQGAQAVAVAKAKVDATQTSRHLRPGAAAEDEGLVRPFNFKQELLICNAYPNEVPITVEKNGHSMLANGHDAVGFQDCKYVAGHVQKHDRLDFSVRGLESHGTFEVGDLPATDSLLLLVLEKRPSSNLVGFQSYAFPLADGQKDAQLAVINAFEGNGSSPHLKMEDHMTGKEVQTVSKRVEQLSFNRVYSVEEGSYDASIKDPRREAEGGGALGAEAELGVGTKKVLKLRRKHNYVVLRTGGGHFKESLVVFPPEEALKSGARPRGGAAAVAGAFAAAVAALAFFLSF